MKRVIIFSVVVLFSVISWAAQAADTVVTFDDFTTDPYATLPYTGTTGYAGFLWSYNGTDGPQVISDAQMTAYSCTVGSPSGNYQARIVGDTPKEITVTRVDGHAFNFTGAKFARYCFAVVATTISITGTVSGGGVVTDSYSIPASG